MSKILEGNIIKKAHAKQEYTKKQIEELKKCSADKEDGHLYFMRNYCYVQHPSKGRVLFEPFEYQLRLIDNYHNERLSINMLARQLGKCVDYNSKITIRNKKDGSVQDITIGEFFDYLYEREDDSNKIDHE